MYVFMCVCRYYSDRLADKFPFIVKESQSALHESGDREGKTCIQYKSKVLV